ncbi:hypothetical protein [Actinomadura litoris]|uniref:Uncharacterized protein n=1 Tax=Actinomadura litoris TaxID=2678616 RepID=A0A7K1KV22_9ACTN|nr:hypothetical protein [Actinomadura litoris]MUN36031.1 hypothetical protein [Actinomadura litoris]
MTGPAAPPDLWVVGYVFEQVFGRAPETVQRVPATLALLDGWTVTLPWGAVAAAHRTDDGSVSLYSMNHYRMAPVSDMPEWAAEASAALAAFATPAPGTRLLLNRELPAALGLLNGDETVQATTRALNDLHGRTNPPLTPPESAGPDQRLLIIVLPPGPSGAPLPAPRRACGDHPLTGAHTFGDPLRDLALTTALEAGALGGRSIGACVVVITPVSAVPRIRAAVTARLPDPPRYLTAPL